MAGERERVDAYLDTVRRMEPEIAMVDRDAAMASIAISLRRIADALEARNHRGEKADQRGRFRVYEGGGDV